MNTTFGSFRRSRRTPPLSHAIGFVVLSLCGPLALTLTVQPTTATAANQKYQSGDWVAECDSEHGNVPECSIMVPFAKSENGQKGAFALAVMLNTGDIAIVGQPAPVRAIVRVDSNPPIECREPVRCLFRRDQSLLAIDQLGRASLLLIDVFTAKTAFKFSLSARGYRAGFAQIRAWNYQLR